jgi:hypothetical protein
MLERRGAAREKMTTRRRRASFKSAIVLSVQFLVMTMMPRLASTQQQSSSSSSSSSSSGGVDFLSTNSRPTIRAMEHHLFSNPDVLDGIERLFLSRVVVEGEEYGDGGVHTFPSLRYTFEGFWRNWKRMMTVGISTGGSGVDGDGDDGRLVLYAGDDIDHPVIFCARPPCVDDAVGDVDDDTVQYNHPSTLEGGGGGEEEDRPAGGYRRIVLRAYGYEYGLVNMAAFLSQAMVDGIHPDTCEERNVQGRRGGEATSTPSSSSASSASASTSSSSRGHVVPPPASNACGQYNSSYQDLICTEDERHMECQVSSDMIIHSAALPSVEGGGNEKNNTTDAVVGFHCGPKDVYPQTIGQPNDLGRTDVEGCCWWGRGPINTRGPCSMGKLNHYLGSKALQDGRITSSTIGGYGDLDFCRNPQSVCESNDEDLLWSVAMLEWAERVQRYRRSSPSSSSYNDEDNDYYDDGVWDYGGKLVEFVDGGMNALIYYPDNEEFEEHRDSFIDAVSSIVDRGCHYAPNCEPNYGIGKVAKLSERRTAFTVALSALRVPTMRNELMTEQALEHLRSRKDGFEANLLLYKRDEGIYPSQRYKFDGLVESIHRMSRPYNSTDALYSTNTTYFSSPDHPPFWLGDPYMKWGYKYGLTNIALFVANGLDLSIDKDDACDEINEHESSGRLAISSSCGQRGLSYQDFGCPDDPDMACVVDPDMYITAVTQSRAFGAAPPMQCGPRSRIQWTGYWDDQEMDESEV